MRLGDAGRVAAGLIQASERVRREFGRLVVAIVDAKLGISEQAPGALLRIGPLAGRQVAGERGPEASDRGVRYLAELVDQARYLIHMRQLSRSFRAVTLPLA